MRSAMWTGLVVGLVLALAAGALWAVTFYALPYSRALIGRWQETPYTSPDYGPPPPPVGVVEKIELERVEGRTLYVSATTTHKDGTWLDASAYREFKHADPERIKGPRRRWHDDLERPARYEAGEVCAPVRVWVAGGAVHWKCEVDDARWLAKQHVRPPLISPQVVVELVGPGGSEMLRVELPLSGPDMPTSGTE